MHVLSPMVPLSSSAEFEFESSQSEGAILVTKHSTYRSDAQLDGRFKKYIIRNFRSWEAFAIASGHDVAVEDLILVTGVDMTADFSMLAFRECDDQLSVSFKGYAHGVASLGMSAWGSWVCEYPVFENWGPQKTQPETSSSSSSRAQEGSSESPEYKQCVFLRGYRVYRRARIFPSALKAGAGPHDLGSGDKHDTEDSACAANYDSDEQMHEVPGGSHSSSESSGNDVFDVVSTVPKVRLS